MLHRITMRVLPAVTLAVTEPGLRSRKRMVMFVAGLLAFVLYRMLHVRGWHADVGTLLSAGALFCSLVAVASYLYGRGPRVTESSRTWAMKELLWFGFRFGGVYAVQLSLMVLGLLKIFSYSYSDHPDGPAMMALIIASTSVARDAFELGHLCSLQQTQPLPTFPTPKTFWNFVARSPSLWLWPTASAGGIASLVYTALAAGIPWVQTDLGQLLFVGVLAGAVGTASYLAGLQPTLSLWRSVSSCPGRELIRFFVWPGVAFGWTYNLILFGITSFLIVLPNPSLLGRGMICLSITALVALYCYYLGWYRWQEEKLHARISPSMLRCPFIFGILTSKKA